MMKLHTWYWGSVDTKSLKVYPYHDSYKDNCYPFFAHCAICGEKSQVVKTIPEEYQEGNKFVTPADMVTVYTSDNIHYWAVSCIAHRSCAERFGLKVEE